MRRIIALFFTTCIAAQAFYNAGVMAYWLANRAYIATTICENKDKPELHCDGKCYLTKKIAAASQPPPSTQGPALPSLLKGLELVDFLPTIPEIQLSETLPLKAIWIPTTPNWRPVTVIRGVFHPPCS